ncbi:MAG: Hsp20/alpha crystallin family protein [Sphingobacteriales bacterium]|jgi:HSP20 family protein
MSETVSKVPVTRQRVTESASVPESFEDLRQQINRLFDDFGQGLWQPFRRSWLTAEPLWRRAATPAVDITESDKAYDVTVELPGMDEKNIEVKVTKGSLTIKGEKQEEKEEKKKDYYLHERHFGSFERSFPMPDGADVDKIEASFKKGVLTVTLPKKPEAQKSAKKIEVKAAA